MNKMILLMVEGLCLLLVMFESIYADDRKTVEFSLSKRKEEGYEY